jgi:probable HAF family extracellular repeat protein
VPGATFTTVAHGINDKGQIVGVFQVEAGGLLVDHGFLRDAAGSFTVIDVPGALSTEVFGINDSGQIVGSFSDASFNRHGFLATPVTTIAVPSTLLLLGAGAWPGGMDAAGPSDGSSAALAPWRSRSSARDDGTAASAGGRLGVGSGLPYRQGTAGDAELRPSPGRRDA